MSEKKKFLQEFLTEMLVEFPVVQDPFKFGNVNSTSGPLTGIATV